MTDEELRELDAWIEQHVELDRLIPIGWVRPYSQDAAAFGVVKREIERRGWRWSSHFHQHRVSPDAHLFEIWTEEHSEDEPTMAVTILGKGYASTEELAGCLAFKAAVEAAGDVL